MVGRSGKDLRVSTFGLAAKPTVTHRVQVETFLVLEPNANEDIPVRRVPALSTFPADSWPMVRNLSSAPSSGGQGIAKDRASSKMH
jgi:hypothetical protein